MALYNKGGTHGTRLFHKPEELYKVFEDYKKDLKEQSNEWQKINYVGKDGNRVVENLKVPMTFEGFKRYARLHHGEVEQYFVNAGEHYTNFVSICRVIKDEIRENQIIGGLLNIFNPSITQRLNNLTERNDITTQGEKLSQPVFNLNYAAPPEED